MEGSGVCFTEPSPEIAGGLCLGRGGSRPPSHIWLLWAVCYQTLPCGKNNQDKETGVRLRKQSLLPPFERCLASSLGIAHISLKTFCTGHSSSGPVIKVKLALRQKHTESSSLVSRLPPPGNFSVWLRPKLFMYFTVSSHFFSRTHIPGSYRY